MTSRYESHGDIRSDNLKINKTGLQPVSRPAEQILGFYPKGLWAKMCSKNNGAKAL